MKKFKKKNKIKHVTCFILDKSGSMEGIRDQVISGFQEYINTLKKKTPNALFYLTLFDSDSIERPYEGEQIKNVEPLTKNTYKPFAMTPLYDSVVSTVKRMEMQVSDLKNTAVSVVIMTDGMENDSREYTERDMQDTVKRLTKKGNWTFAYMGANQDAWATARKLGISMGNTIQWESTIKGSMDAYRNLADASVFYASAMQTNANAGKSLSTEDFFSDKKNER